MPIIRNENTSAILHTSNIKAHSSFQCCINQGQDLAQPRICRHLHWQFFHFLLAFNKTVEKDPMQIQLYHPRPQPGCSAASLTSSIPIFSFIPAFIRILKQSSTLKFTSELYKSILFPRQTSGQKPSMWCPE